MPRKKISIEEAFAALQAAGINVQVKPAQPEPEQLEPDIELFEEPPLATRQAIHYGRQRKIGSSNVKITLYAAHTIGSSGYTVGVGADKHVESNGVLTYGPGVVTVPNDIAAHLLHQDGLARQADAKLLDPTFRSFLIVERRTPQGHTANIGVPVSSLDDMFAIQGGVYRMG